MLEKNIIVLPHGLEDNKDQIATFVNAIFSREYDFFSINSDGYPSLEDKTFIENQIDTLGIYLNVDNIRTVIDDSLGLYSRSLDVIEQVVDGDIKDRDIIAKRNRVNFILRNVTIIFNSMLGKEEPSISNEEIKDIEKILVKTNISIGEVKEFYDFIFVFTDKNLILNLSLFYKFLSYGIYNKDTRTLSFEQIRIIRGTLKVYIETIEECNRNVRVNDRLDWQLANLVNIYLYLNNKIKQ